MEVRHAIVYISNASADMNLRDIEQLLKISEERNQNLNIKGILLYSDGNFFQVLEGEKKVVLELWQKIQNDSRHYGIMQVVGKDISKVL